MPAQVSTVGEIVKVTFKNVLTDMVQSRRDLFAMMRKKFDADGSSLTQLHRTAGISSMRFQSGTAALPTATSQQYATSTITPKKWWGTISVDQELVDQSKTDVGSFIRAIESEMEFFAEDAYKYFEIRIVGDGSGGLAQPVNHAGANGGAGGVVEYMGGLGSEGIYIDIRDARKFTVGQIITVWSSKQSGATQRTVDGSVTVQAQIYNIVPVPADASLAIILTVQAYTVSHTITANDWITVDGSRESSTPYEIMGLTGAINDQDAYLNNSTNAFQGITSPYQEDGTTVNALGEPTWASYVSTSSTARPLDDVLLQEALDAIEIQSNGSADKILTGFGVRLKLAVGFQTVRRNVNTNTISGGTGMGFSEDTKTDRYIEYGGRKIIPHRFLDPSLALVTDWKQHVLHFWARFQWWDGDGSVLRRNPDGFPRFDAEHRATLEYMMMARNAHARIENLEHDELKIL